MVSKKTMELNPNHPIVSELKKKSDKDKSAYNKDFLE